MKTVLSSGNRKDSDGMDCDTAREALSALLDGEALPCTPEDLDAHTATCHECRHWREAAHLVTRRARLTSASSAPDSTDRIWAAVLANRPSGRRKRTAGLVRGALAATALAHGLIIVPAAIGWAGRGVPLQAERELAVFNLTLAVALLTAAARPAWARAMLPVVGVAAGLLALISLVDIAVGEATLLAEAPHLITLVGAVLLAMLIRVSGGDTDGPARRSPPLQGLRRALRQRFPLSGLAGFVRPSAHSGVWTAAHGPTRARWRTALADDGTDSAEDGDPVRRVA
jgi:predicted anti-sigma-YlaC factor YlaD